MHWSLLGMVGSGLNCGQRWAIDVVTPLRLMSWLSCQLSDRTHLLIKECMAEFSQVEPVHSDKILEIGQFHLPDAGRNWQTWDNMRDAVIDEITVKGRAQPPAVVVNLIRGFLQRLPLPRLLHFVDLVLPQMVPVCSPCSICGFQVSRQSAYSRSVG